MASIFSGMFDIKRRTFLIRSSKHPLSSGTLGTVRFQYSFGDSSADHCLELSMRPDNISTPPLLRPLFSALCVRPLWQSSLPCIRFREIIDDRQQLPRMVSKSGWADVGGRTKNVFGDE